MQNLLPRIRVHIGGGFVQKKQLRIAAEPPGDEHPLPLSPRKSPKGAPLQIVEPHLLQSLPGRLKILLRVASPGPVPEPSRKHHLQHRNGKGPVEKGVLGGVPHPVTALLGGSAEKKHPPTRGSEKPQCQLEEGGLSSSVGAHDAGEFPRPHEEIHPLENGTAFIGKGKILKFQDGAVFLGFSYFCCLGYFCCFSHVGHL